MKQNFGVERGGHHGRVIGTIEVGGPVECLVLLRAIEAGLRLRPDDAILHAKRRQLMNMRYRACREDWVGWA